MTQEQINKLKEYEKQLDYEQREITKLHHLNDVLIMDVASIKNGDLQELVRRCRGDLLEAVQFDLEAHIRQIARIKQQIEEL
jgi:hypothetical protein